MRRKWTDQEDTLLETLVKKHSAHWSLIAGKMHRRSAAGCKRRWEQVLNVQVKKGRFTEEEDKKICKHVQENGATNWGLLSFSMPQRTSVQCRTRWFEGLDPRLKKSPWSSQEDRLICKYHGILGPRWSCIAEHVKGRTAKAIREHFMQSLQQR
eukprot:jgi/Bigna1/30406/gw1.5.185.1